MRTFIILLLLTNIAYFGWNQGWLREPPPDAARAPLQLDRQVAKQPFEQAGQSLTLLLELSEAERAALAATAGQQNPPLAAPAAAGLAANPASEPAPAAQPATAAVPASAAGSEPAAASEAPAASESVVAAAPVPAAPRPWCAELGPIADVAQAQALLPRLAALDITAELQTQEVPVSSTFWVYMPAFASEAEARRMLAELQERKIDSYYMRSGQFPGGISLGVFSRRASAETVQANLARQGYQSQIGEVERMEPRATLRLRAADAASVTGPAAAEFKALVGNHSLAENVCESVASEF